MDYQQLLDSLSPEIYARLKLAIETGRWPDGSALTAEQREHALQAVIAWGEKHLPVEERVGFIDKGRKAAASNATAEQPETLRWRDDDGGAP